MRSLGMRVNWRQSIAWLHGWAGILVGWILYAVFVTGTLSYFHKEISHWMRPELGEARMHPDAIALAMRILEERAAASPRWLIDLPEPRRPTLRLGWSIVPERGTPGNLLRRFESVELNPATAEELHGRSTRGGGFFQRFHSELSIRPVWGRWVVGGCAMVMLVSILSGFITHRDILRKMFTFRPGKGPRPWLEAHTLAGVLALPFHAMITYTGLVTLMLLYMPAAVEANYRYDSGAFLAEITANPAASAITGRRGDLTAIEPLLREASRRWRGARPASLSIDNPSDAGARIHMRRSDAGRISTNAQIITFDGATGEVLSSTPDELPALRTYGTLQGLHAARFSPVLLRWLFAFCGLVGAGMVASGLILWSVRRVPDSRSSKSWSVSYRSLQTLNVGVIAGIWWGIAAYFLANRLLPPDFATRSVWEVRSFFIAWAASVLVAALQHARWAWSTQFALCTLAFASLPLVNALTTPVHLGNSVSHGLWIYAGFDLAMIGLATMFAVAAWLAARGNLPIASVSNTGIGRTCSYSSES